MMAGALPEAIWLEDPIENMGANIMKEIAVQADKESGDGTTTAMTIAQVLTKAHGQKEGWE